LGDFELTYSRGLYNRRRNTSSNLSQSALDTNSEEIRELEFDELEFDVEMYNALNDNNIKSEDILLRKAMKKDASKNGSRLLQRHFLSYVHGSAAFEKFWLLSDSEVGFIKEALKSLF
jgi:hypothetical protein